MFVHLHIRKWVWFHYGVAICSNNNGNFLIFLHVSTDFHSHCIEIRQVLWPRLENWRFTTAQSEHGTVAMIYGLAQGKFMKHQKTMSCMSCSIGRGSCKQAPVFFALNAYLSRLLPQIIQFWIFAQCVHHFFYESVFLPSCSMCSLRMGFGGDDRIQCGNPNVGLIPTSTAKIG